MPDPEVQALANKLDALLEDSSIPEMLAAMIVLCRSYADAAEVEKQGWLVWDRELSDALRRALGDRGYESLLE